MYGFTVDNFILWDLKFTGHVNYYHIILKFTDKHLYERNMRKSMTQYVELIHTQYPEVQLLTFK